jgi:hypothetical protein
MNQIKIVLVAVAVATSVVISLAIHQREKLQLRERLDSSAQQTSEINRLAAENQRLSNLVVQVKSSGSLSKSQLTELLKLRSEIGQLRQTETEKPQLQAANAKLRSLDEQAEKQLAEAKAAPNYWPKEQLSYAGYADPESALESLLAAMKNGGNLSSWRTSCTPEAVNGLEQEWKKHGLSEEQQEAEVKTMANMFMSASSGFHIIDQKLISPDEAVINLSFDGEGKARKFVLRKTGNEWKFHNLLFGGEEDPAAR